MDVYDRLNQLTATVRSAKPMPMSASCLVNRAEMLETLERLRDELPTTLNHADVLLSDRQAVLAAGREQAERILASARDERERLVEETDVLVAARARAAALTEQARAESTRLLSDADAYVDRKLAEFEVLLGQVTLQLNNGRLRLTTRREADLAHFEQTSAGRSGDDERRQDQTVQPGRAEVADVSGAAAPASAGISLAAR
jgi:cell division septum initiation protein DivIVA